MDWLKPILNRLNGLHFSQEYLCLDAGSFTSSLYAFLLDQGKPVMDITRHHAFIGYSPLVLSLPQAIGPKETIRVGFSTVPLSPNEDFNEKDAVALLDLKKIEVPTENIGCFFYEGVECKHRFLPSFNQAVIELNNRLYNKKPGNVYLHPSLYRQVQVAYSLPRKISLITVGKDGYFNLFPTDLHGQVDAENYIISLRFQGKACKQVVQSEKILLSDVRPDAYKTVYGLGRNHMQELKERSNFPFSKADSASFGLPIPEAAVVSRELELRDSFIHGIHRILLFRVHSRISIQDDPSSFLAHIHAVYGSWRKNKQLPGNYLMR